jgi:hypothetical protein
LIERLVIDMETGVMEKRAALPAEKPTS